MKTPQSESQDYENLRKENEKLKSLLKEYEEGVLPGEADKNVDYHFHFEQCCMPAVVWLEKTKEWRFYNYKLDRWVYISGYTRVYRRPSSLGKILLNRDY